MAAPVEFYFDFSSPFGYLASERIDDIAGRHGRTTVWRPFLLGAVFKVVGTAPLLDYPLKGDYSRHDMARSARLHRVPFSLPKEFPTASIAACRAFYWLSDHQPGLAKPFARAAYRRYFVDNKPIDPPGAVIEVASALGVEAGALTAALQDSAVKERLKTEVDAAIKRGVFGSPYIYVDGEPFWGADRLDQIERWLETGGW